MKYPLSSTGIDRYVRDTEDEILRLLPGYSYPFGPTTVIQPLRWYIVTGRASGAWIRSLLSVRPSAIARRLLQGGTDEEIIDRINTVVYRKMKER